MPDTLDTLLADHIEKPIMPPLKLAMKVLTSSAMNSRGILAIARLALQENNAPTEKEPGTMQLILFKSQRLNASLLWNEIKQNPMPQSFKLRPNNTWKNIEISNLPTD